MQMAYQSNATVCTRYTVVHTGAADAAADATLRFGGRAKMVQQHAKVNATVDVNALAERLQVPELAESLQQQLDEPTRLTVLRSVTHVRAMSRF